MMFCVKCGSPMEQGDFACSHCGAQVAAAAGNNVLGLAEKGMAKSDKLPWVKILKVLAWVVIYAGGILSSIIAGISTIVALNAASGTFNAWTGAVTSGTAGWFPGLMMIFGGIVLAHVALAIVMVFLNLAQDTAEIKTLLRDKA